MATVDMDVIKEIPGYKVILKAVLKSQIQQLVEQLASHTDEESVILTASVSDGTLSHLGSQSGKFFLEDHEDIKSQFLGFCLKRHHKQKQLEKDREEVQRSGEVTPPGYIIHHQGQRFASMRTPGMPSPRQQALHPVAMSRVSPGTQSPGFRHEPYPRTRPPRRPGNVPQSVVSPGQNQITMKLPLEAKDYGQVIKIEQDGVEESSNQNNPGDENTRHTPSPSQCLDESAQVNTDITNKDSDVSDSDTGAVHTEGLEPKSFHSNVVSDASDQPGTSGSAVENSGNAVDTDLIVKLEAISESEMDLEITGMEPGRSVMSQENWAANVTMDMGFDPMGATGMQLDLQGSQQGYSHETLVGQKAQMLYQPLDPSNAVQLHMESGAESFTHLWGMGGNESTRGVHSETHLLPIESHPVICDPSKRHKCHCGKAFATRLKLEEHYRTHTGEKPFTCEFCGKSFALNGNLTKHKFVHLNIDV